MEARKTVKVAKEKLAQTAENMKAVVKDAAKIETDGDDPDGGPKPSQLRAAE